MSSIWPEMKPLLMHESMNFDADGQTGSCLPLPGRRVIHLAEWSGTKMKTHLMETVKTAGQGYMTPAEN